MIYGKLCAAHKFFSLVSLKSVQTVDESSSWKKRKYHLPASESKVQPKQSFSGFIELQKEKEKDKCCCWFEHGPNPAHEGVVLVCLSRSKYAKLFRVNNTNNMLMVLTLNMAGAQTTICFHKQFTRRTKHTQNNMCGILPVLVWQMWLVADICILWIFHVSGVCWALIDERSLKARSQSWVNFYQITPACSC